MYSLLKLPKHDLAVMARTIVTLAEGINVCDGCYTYAETTRCEICSDPKREPHLLCVVEEPRDISTIEATGAYRGRYLVLGGILNPIEGMTPETLRIRELSERLGADANIAEVILALSPNIQGETTMLYLAKRLAPSGRKITRLARGLPTGATLEYADEVTLGDALKGRRDA